MRGSEKRERVEEGEGERDSVGRGDREGRDWERVRMDGR